MTLLANEATQGSAKLLSKYKKPKAKNHADLEVKLAELYFEQPDKVEFEKELAEIHPHKKWLIRTLDLVERKSAMDDVSENKKEDSVKSSCFTEQCFDANCPIHGRNSQVFSNFTEDANKTKSEVAAADNTMKYVALLGAIGIISLTLIIVSKNSK